MQRAAGVSRSKAQGLIISGQVMTADGQRLDKPGMRLQSDTNLTIRAQPRFVSRGGEKLQAAIDQFNLHEVVCGSVAVDVGASTGGFTDCLLQNGAARVIAVDVGYGQLAWKLRRDERVEVLERTNIRHLTHERLTVRPSFFTVDCSFISLGLILGPVRELLAETGRKGGVCLIKPQFEAGRDQVGKGGVVRDEKVRERVVSRVLEQAREVGFISGGVIPSPLIGPAGNKEYLAFFRTE